jgi:hypothetical protein
MKRDYYLLRLAPETASSQKKVHFNVESLFFYVESEMIRIRDEKFRLPELSDTALHA